MTAYDHQAITEHLMDGYEEPGTTLFETCFSSEAMSKPDWQRRFLGWLHSQPVDGIEQTDDNVCFVVPDIARHFVRQGLETFQRRGFIDGWQEL
jgi:hypothetical protein